MVKETCKHSEKGPCSNGFLHYCSTSILQHRAKRTKPVLRPYWILTLSFGMLLSILLTQTQLQINQTPSLGYKIFFCLKGLAAKRGDFVSFTKHSTAYFGNLSYTKRLIGLPGDEIRENHGQLFVDGRSVGSLLTMTRDGKPLSPLKAKQVPEGYVFVSADHSRSFDSRYEEFGLVKQTCLWGRCFGLFKSSPPLVNTYVQKGSL